MLKEIEPIISLSIFIGSIVLCYQLGKYNRKLVNKTICNYYKKQNTDEENIEKEKKLFNLLLSKDSSYTNSNIHPDIYCYEALQHLQKKLSDEEKTWKSRILMQNVSNGNVIMYYDLYKQSFSYFADSQISYKYLTFCAMKYVRTFLCLDFFTDTAYLPTEHVNPFNKMKQEEIKKEVEKKIEKKKKLKINFSSDVFICKKKGKKEKKEKKEKKDVAEKFINNFCHLGKIHNYSVTQKNPKKESICQDYQYIDFKANFNKNFTSKFDDLFT